MSRLTLLSATSIQRQPISRFLVGLAMHRYGLDQPLGSHCEAIQALGATPWQAKLAALEARLVDNSECLEGELP